MVNSRNNKGIFLGIHFVDKWNISEDTNYQQDIQRYQGYAQPKKKKKKKIMKSQ
jgi:hypothetical protein